jgi:cytochrome b561
MTVTRYSKTAIWLHWISAAVMVFMLFFSEDFIKVPRGSSLAGWEPSTHASWGIVVLLLAVTRLLWRIGNPAPALPTSMGRLQTLATHGAHAGLYVLMILTPVFGLLALIPYGAERQDVDQVVFFNLFSVAFMPNLGEWTGEAHEILSKLTQILVILHVLAALKHQFWDKDGIMSRMRPM